MDRDKMSNRQRGPAIDASYQVSLHLAEGFQRRRLKCEKLTDDRRRTPSDGKSSHCLWQGELKIIHLTLKNNTCVTRWVPELLSLPKHLSSSPPISGVSVRSIVFCVVFCRLLIVLLLWAIVSSVLLRFTASNIIEIYRF